MYDKLITLKKMAYQGAMVFISGGVTALVNFMETQTPETNATIFAVLLVLCKGAENYFKHKDN